MNVPYYNPYPQFYGQPMPDQLAQLRQGVFQPPQQQMPTQQTTQSCEVVWVSGEGEANGYMVAPGSKVILMDRDTQTFYVKCRDVNNMPYPMEVYDYHKRESKSEEKPNAIKTAKDSKGGNKCQTRCTTDLMKTNRET